MQSATELDGFEFDVFPPREDGLTPTEVDIGRSEVVEALVVTPSVVVIDELGESRFQLTGQVEFSSRIWFFIERW